MPVNILKKLHLFTATWKTGNNQEITRPRVLLSRKTRTGTKEVYSQLNFRFIKFPQWNLIPNRKPSRRLFKKKKLASRKKGSNIRLSSDEYRNKLRVTKRRLNIDRKWNWPRHFHISSTTFIAIVYQYISKSTDTNWRRIKQTSKKKLALKLSFPLFRISCKCGQVYVSDNKTFSFCLYYVFYYCRSNIYVCVSFYPWTFY